MGVPNNQSLTLAELIASVVNDLSRNSTTVVAFCCDNAPSNISAFNGNENSAQHKSGKNFRRQPCASHTANLVIKDSFDSKDEFGFVYNIITFLMRNKPEESFRKDFSPVLITEISQIPSYEAAVEGQFTALSRATRGEMCNSSVSSLNARMIVEFDCIFKELGLIKWEEFAEKIENLDL